MFASRASAARGVPRAVRSFATVVDTAGVKVAAVDNGEPTSAVTVLVKAGSRYETKPGLAHALKGFAFKSTGKRSALGTIREAELYGGVLSTSLTREHLAVTAEFLRGDEQFFVDVLSSFVTSAKFTRHELYEYVVPLCQAESTSLLSDPATHALEAAHALAFRAGLGASVFSSAGNAITIDDVKAYASKVFGAGNIAVLGSGIDPTTLQGLVEKSLSGLSSSASVSSTPSKYFGGETRVDGHGSAETVFIGFGTTGATAPELAVLAAHLDPTPAVKWSQGLSPIASSIPAGTSVRSVLLPYSDATLFGLLVQGPTTAAVKEAGTAAVTALKAAANLKGDDLKKAIGKAKFAAAHSFDKREGLLSALAHSAFGVSPASLDGVVSGLDKVDASAVSKLTSSLLKSKPTYVALGDTASLPYADELGLGIA